MELPVYWILASPVMWRLLWSFHCGMRGSPATAYPWLGSRSSLPSKGLVIVRSFFFSYCSWSTGIAAISLWRMELKIDRHKDVNVRYSTWMSGIALSRLNLFGRICDTLV
ncbi:hypothetical protein F5X96DRAFT_622017 [Biscogniauxia mediterranea]|nr:hypothetical protein F5X96DRAFT_622017 [Biscogniauxia mediterranea]